MKSVLVTGGTGFIGRPLVHQLVVEGYKVTVLARNPAAARGKLPAAVNVIADLCSLKEEGATPDILVNLAGEPLAAKRWSPEFKEVIRASRIGLTDDLFTFFERCGVFPARIINGSAIGYYGSCGEQLIDEQRVAGTGFAAQLCHDWELSAKQFEQRGSSLCLLRTGIVLGVTGGALKQMLPAFRLGLGGPIGSGEQYMSWIHLNDMVRLIMFLINHPELDGPINSVSPQPVTNRDFSRALAGALGRPALMPMPRFILKLLFGEMAESLLLASQRVFPAQAINSGFEFHYPQLEGAFRNLLKK